MDTNSYVFNRNLMHFCNMYPLQGSQDPCSPSPRSPSWGAQQRHLARLVSLHDSSVGRSMMVNLRTMDGGTSSAGGILVHSPFEEAGRDVFQWNQPCKTSPLVFPQSWATLWSQTVCMQFAHHCSMPSLMLFSKVPQPWRVLCGECVCSVDRILPMLHLHILPIALLSFYSVVSRSVMVYWLQSRESWVHILVHPRSSR